MSRQDFALSLTSPGEKAGGIASGDKGLKDDAPAFDPFTRAPAAGLALGVDERSVGGLGIHLVRRTMDDCRWHYVDGGNLVVLRKRLPAMSREQS